MKKVMRIALYYPSRENVVAMFKSCDVNDFNRRSASTLNQILQKVITYAPEYVPYLYKRSEKIRRHILSFYIPSDRYVVTWALRIVNYIPSSDKPEICEMLRVAITQKFSEECITSSEILLPFDEKVKKYKSKQLKCIPAIAEVMFKLKEYEYTNDEGKKYRIPKTYVIDDESDVEDLFVCSEGGYDVSMSFERNVICLDRVAQMEQGHVSLYALAYALKQGIIKDDIIIKQDDLLNVYALAGMQKQGIKNPRIQRSFSEVKLNCLEKLYNGEVIS